MRLAPKTILSLIITLCLVGGLFIIAPDIMAAETGVGSTIGNLDAAAPTSIKGDNLASAPAFIGTVVNGFLSIMSIVFFLLTVYGGWLWMTAQGDPAQVKKGKDTIIAAIIGLIIIGASYGITTLAFENFIK